MCSRTRMETILVKPGPNLSHRVIELLWQLISARGQGSWINAEVERELSQKVKLKYRFLLWIRLETEPSIINNYYAE